MNLFLLGVMYFSVLINILSFILRHCKIIWKIKALLFQASSEQFKTTATLSWTVTIAVLPGRAAPFLFPFPTGLAYFPVSFSWTMLGLHWPSSALHRVLSLQLLHLSLFPGYLHYHQENHLHTFNPGRALCSVWIPVLAEWPGTFCKR